jgi:zinc ribbon protein
VYCPSCSSLNNDEVKFCTRCGTNLGVVSDALSGKHTSSSQIDERMVSLFKDYYSGRNSVIIGGVVCAIVLFKVMLFALFNFNIKPDFLSYVAGFLLVYGLIALIWGAGRWNNAASEIKAIERAASEHLHLSTEPSSVATPSHSTDPIAIPVSVTERTTHLLENQESEPAQNQRA